MPGFLIVNSNIIQEQESYQVENRQILKSLSSRFGREIAQNAWEMLSEEKRSSILSGRVALKTHEDAFEKKCLSILLDQVLSAKQDALLALHTPKSVIHDYFSNYSVEELKSMEENAELSDLDITAIRKLAQERETSIRQNEKLIAKLEETYSKPTVDKILSKLSPSKKQQIEEGSLKFIDHLKSFQDACEKINSSQSYWLSDSDLLIFFQRGKIMERKSGYNGVLILDGIHQGKPLKLVIKCPEKPAQETFGSKVMEVLNIRSPLFRVAAVGENGIFEAAIDLFERDPNISADETLQYKQAEFMFIMEYLPGDTLEDIDPQIVQTTLLVDPDAMYDKVLLEIGEIAAADLLLYYRDRLPVLGMGNLANAMILKSEGGTYNRSAAIDQVAYLSSEQTELDQMMGISPFSRVKSLVEDITALPNGVSEIAKDLFDSAFPDDVKALLDQERAETSLQRGLESGLAKIKATSKEALAEIHLTLPASPNSRDHVDLRAYQKMLHLIQSTAI